MIYNKKLNFTYKQFRCEFRTLLPSEVSSDYVVGLRLEDKYLSNKPDEYTIQSQAAYVTNILNSTHSTLCGLFANGKLMGTAGIQGLGDKLVVPIGIFLFDPSLRGQGFGKVLVWGAAYLTNQVAETTGIYGGMKSENIASRKAFEACGGTTLFIEGEDKNLVTVLHRDLRTPGELEDVQVTDFSDVADD